MLKNEKRHCNICNVDTYRASYAKHFRSQKHLGNNRQGYIIIPERVFKKKQQHIKNKILKIQNAKPLRKIDRQNIRLDHKELFKELARKIFNPYYFTVRAVRVGFNITLDSYHINHANCILSIIPIFIEVGIENRYVKNFLQGMATIYARLMNQYKFKYHTLFPASFYNISEEYQRSGETELFIKLNTNHNLTESDFDNSDVKFQLERQIQIRETKDFDWMFDKISSMKISFYKISELNISKDVKIPLRSNAILNIENNDEHCFIWSKLAQLHPREKSHPTRVKNYRQNFIELNIQGSDFSNGFKCIDVQKIEKLNNLSINLFDSNFFRGENRWEQNLIPIDVSENESDIDVDLLLYKIQKLLCSH